MSNHNYTQYSNKKHNDAVKVEPEVCVDELATPELEDVVTTAAVDVEPAEVKMVEETVEPEVIAKTVDGKVINCAKLNVRENPSLDANVVCVLDADAEIEINVEKTTDEWANVYTATGIEGYCMRKFIDACL
jgi:hypothetical protein